MWPNLFIGQKKKKEKNLTLHEKRVILQNLKIKPFNPLSPSYDN
jgi:hypothetical protein